MTAFREAGLDATNERDNTQSCTFADAAERSCLSLVTTDQVSVYEWRSEAAAQGYMPLAGALHRITRRPAGFGAGARSGATPSSWGGDSDHPVADAQPYLAAAAAAVGG